MEYLVLESVKVQDLQETLTNHGKLGWDLVSATHVHSVRPFFMLIFKQVTLDHPGSYAEILAEIESEQPQLEGPAPESVEPPRAPTKKEKAKSPVNIGVTKK